MTHRAFCRFKKRILTRPGHSHTLQGYQPIKFERIPACLGYARESVGLLCGFLPNCDYGLFSGARHSGSDHSQCTRWQRQRTEIQSGGTGSELWIQTWSAFAGKCNWKVGLVIFITSLGLKKVVLELHWFQAWRDLWSSVTSPPLTCHSPPLIAGCHPHRWVTTDVSPPHPLPTDMSPSHGCHPHSLTCHRPPHTCVATPLDVTTPSDLPNPPPQWNVTPLRLSPHSQWCTMAAKNLTFVTKSSFAYLLWSDPDLINFEMLSVESIEVEGGNPFLRSHIYS